jgi:O-antigen/teichoic acid export membrane protein
MKMFHTQLTSLKSILQKSSAKKYIFNTSWLFGEKIFRIVVAFFVEAWVARYLGPEGYGSLSYAQSFVLIFAAISTLGLDGIVVRELVKDPAKKNIIIGTSFILKLFSSVTLVLLITLFIALYGDSPTDLKLMIWVMSFGLVFQSFNVIDFFFQSEVKSKFVALSNFFVLIVSSIIKIILIHHEASVISFAVVYLIDSIFLAFFLLIFYKYEKHQILKWRFNKVISLKLLNYSWPLILSGLAISINMRIDQIMLRQFMDDHSVGIYAAASRIMDIVNMIPHLVASSVFPAFVSANKRSSNIFFKRISIAYRGFSLTAVLACTVLLILSPYIIYLAYGSEYSETTVIFQVLIFTSVFSSIGAINAIYLKVNNLQKKIMNRHWINIIINIVMNYILINTIGIIGAAISTVIAIISTTVIYDYFDKELSEMNKAKMFILGVRYEGNR